MLIDHVLRVPTQIDKTERQRDVSATEEVARLRDQTRMNSFTCRHLPETVSTQIHTSGREEIYVLICSMTEFAVGPTAP
jgi:hypothetical protein